MGLPWSKCTCPLSSCANWTRHSVANQIFSLEMGWIGWTSRKENSRLKFIIANFEREKNKTSIKFKRPNNVKVILVNATISIKMISDETKKNRVIIIEDLKILEEDFLTMLMMSWAVMMMNNFFQTKKRYPLFSHVPNSALLRDPPSYCSFFAFLKHISQSRNY